MAPKIKQKQISNYEEKFNCSSFQAQIKEIRRQKMYSLL